MTEISAADKAEELRRYVFIFHYVFHLSFYGNVTSQLMAESFGWPARPVLTYAKAFLFDMLCVKDAACDCTTSGHGGVTAPPTGHGSDRMTVEGCKMRTVYSLSLSNVYLLSHPVRELLFMSILFLFQSTERFCWPQFSYNLQRWPKWSNHTLQVSYFI